MSTPHERLFTSDIHGRMRDVEAQLAAEQRHFAANQGTPRAMPHRLADLERRVAYWREEYRLSRAAGAAERAEQVAA